MLAIGPAAGGWLLYSRKTHKLSETDAIVLADFENSTGDAVLDGTLKEALAIVMSGIDTQLGQYDKVLAEVRKSIRLDPENAGNYDDSLEFAYLELNRLDQARAAARRAEEKSHDPAGVHEDLYAIDFLEANAAGMSQQVAWASSPAYAAAVLPCVSVRVTLAPRFRRRRARATFPRTAASLNGVARIASSRGLPATLSRLMAPNKTPTNMSVPGNATGRLTAQVSSGQQDAPSTQWHVEPQ